MNPVAIWRRLGMGTVACVMVLVLVLPSGAAGEPSVRGDAGDAGDAELALGTPVLSARRAPGFMAEQSGQLALTTELDGIMASAPPDSCLVVATGQRVLYRYQGDRALSPASTMKLITAAVAIEVLGPDHRWTTAARSVEPAVAGVLDGDLYLVGGGDPLLSTSGYAASLPDPLTRLTSPLEQLADAVVGAGITRVTGAVVGDGSRYDDEVVVATWPASYQLGSTVGSLGALRVNAGREGWADNPAVVTVGGNGGNPSLLAAATFTRLLEARGVAVDGPAAVGVAPVAARPIAEMVSPQLGDMLDELLAWSDNGLAELVVKEMGLVVSGTPTTPGGIAVVVSTLDAWGLAGQSAGDGDEGLVFVEGSGLDTGNRLSCDVLAGLVSLLGNDDDARSGDVRRVDVLDGLARPGSPGTLWGRLGEPAAIGRVRAKTGTLNTVRGLTGDVASAVAGSVGFAFLVNAPPFAAGLSHDTADAVVRVLLEYPRLPDPDVLGPRRPIAEA